MENKPKHTPGPWKLTTDKRGNPAVEFPNMRSSERAANAALIAAAPDMLEVMKEAQGLLDNASPELRKKYRAAIAKAEGGK